jgi:outer membrane immunogenic protein
MSGTEQTESEWALQICHQLQIARGYTGRTISTKEVTMQLLKSALLASVACAIAAPGFAADLSRPVPYTKAPIAEPVSAYNWSGFYLGANAGAKWANFDETFRSGTLTPLGFSGDSDVSWLAGGQLGFMWQTGQFVFGIEGDMDATHLHNSFTSVGVVGPFVAGDSFAIKNDWQASARGRLGYAFDRTLLYVTGGGAWANVKTTAAFVPVGTIPGVVLTNNRTIFGWTLGGGIDYGIAPGWSIGAEYRFTRFERNNNDLGFITPVVPVAFDTHLDTNEVTARVNYHFNWSGPVAARY